MIPARRPLELLVVEDNSADVVLLKEAVAGTREPVRLHVVGDGGDALRFLRRGGEFHEAPRPDAVVLDLNLPVVPGAEVLGAMAADPDLRTIPVAILTSSSVEQPLCGIYPPGRCRYFVKTDEIAELEEIVRQIVAHAWRAGLEAP